MKKNTFKKEERLCSRTIISQLFQHPKIIRGNKLRILWMFHSLTVDYPAQVLITVPKKKGFKRAVDRNLIRRRIKETYRCNKHILYKTLEKNNQQIVLAIIYNHKEIASFSDIQSELMLTLKRLLKEINQKIKNDETSETVQES